MAIRALTSDELDMIKTVKQSANDRITGYRRRLKQNRKRLTARERTDLENKLAYYERITGKPIVVMIDGREIYLDYELLQKFIRSLDRQKFMFYSFAIAGSEFNRVLMITYDNGPFAVGSGTAELFELPSRQRDLLSGYLEFNCHDALNRWVRDRIFIRRIEVIRMLGNETNKAIKSVIKERKRQDKKWGEQNHHPVFWLGILGEEYGELCQAVNETVWDNGPEERAKGGLTNLRAEAIQVAAVAVAFVEMLDRQPKCRVCGCTEFTPCPDGCCWIEENLCSSCAEKEGDS